MGHGRYRLAPSWLAYGWKTTTQTLPDSTKLTSAPNQSARGKTGVTG